MGRNAVGEPRRNCRSTRSMVSKVGMPFPRPRVVASLRRALCRLTRVWPAVRGFRPCLFQLRRSRQPATMAELKGEFHDCSMNDRALINPLTPLHR